MVSANATSPAGSFVQLADGRYWCPNGEDHGHDDHHEPPAMNARGVAMPAVRPLTSLFGDLAVARALNSGSEDMFAGYHAEQA